MRKTSVAIPVRILLAAVVLLFSDSLLAATVGMPLKWSELSPVITGHSVQLNLNKDVTIKGKVLEVMPDAMVVDVSSSSNSKAYAKGRREIPRTSVALISLTRMNGKKGRTIGALVGVGIGIPGGWFTGHLQGAKGGVIGAALTVGFCYLIGWAHDRQTIVIRILPN